MAKLTLNHGAEASKMMYNISNGSITADSQGRIFFDGGSWEDCLVHGADSLTKESYVGKFEVEIPDGVTLERAATQGNRSARILKLEPGASVSATMTELYVRRGTVGEFTIERIPGARAGDYLRETTLKATGGGGGGGGLGGKVTPKGPGGGTTIAQAEAITIVGIVAVGAILNWISDYITEERIKADVTEWENYIRQQQTTDPHMGILVVITLSQVIAHPDSAYQPSPTYVGLTTFYAETQGGALDQHRRTSGALRQAWENYIYRTAWIPPLYPPPPKIQGEPTTSWGKRYKLVKQSLSPEPDFQEAFNVLNGSWMMDILYVLEQIRLDGDLPWFEKKLETIGGVDMKRLRAAFAAVRMRADELDDWDLYLNFYSTDLNSLPTEQRKEIQDFFNTGQATAKTALKGKWRVRVSQWTWIYEFDGKSWVRWTDPMNGMTGEGSWSWSSSSVSVFWSPKSKTTEVWDLPLNPGSQTGTCKMQEGTFPIRAVKIS